MKKKGKKLLTILQNEVSKLYLNKEQYLPYSIGALLYTPANNQKVASFVINESFGSSYSLALCLEDSIHDAAVEQAEGQLVQSIRKISQYAKAYAAEAGIPKIFIRVRAPQQALQLYKKIADFDSNVVKGFIFPKYSLDCVDEYQDVLLNINKQSNHKIFMMPILESQDILDIEKRPNILLSIKKQLDDIKPYVLNIRVGGNDFCRELGIRRRYDETIYEIALLNHVLGDIISVFSKDYVVSAPVWEYFSGLGGEWETGLKKELKLDRLNGFIGKTVIHPRQISVVTEALQVSDLDYADASAILGWGNTNLMVGKSMGGDRMNEVKIHRKWAEKIMILASIYGIA